MKSIAFKEVNNFNSFLLFIHYLLIYLILIGQTQTGKARTILGCTDSNHWDLIAWRCKFTSLKWTSCILTSPDTHVVILSNLSNVPLLVISFFYFILFVKKQCYFFFIKCIYFFSPEHQTPIDGKLYSLDLF